MGKQIEIRARCNQALKNRVANYIAHVEARGGKSDESTVVRDAIVEFLDRREITPAAETGKGAAPTEPKAHQAAALAKAQALKPRSTRKS